MGDGIWNFTNKLSNLLEYTFIIESEIFFLGNCPWVGPDTIACQWELWDCLKKNGQAG